MMSDDYEEKTTARFPHPVAVTPDTSTKAPGRKGTQTHKNTVSCNNSIRRMDEPSRRPTRLYVAVDWNRAFTFFLNQQCDSDVKGRDLIHIEAGSKCWIETYTGAVVITRAGLCTFTSLGNVFTIVCGTWDLLKTCQNAGPNIIEKITEACHTRKSLESDGHRTRHDTICTQET
jgi:hypothetical protein